MWLSRTNDEVGGGVLRAVPFFRAEGPALSMRCRSLVTLASVTRTCGHRLSAGPWHEGRFFCTPCRLRDTILYGRRFTLRHRHSPDSECALSKMTIPLPKKGGRSCRKRSTPISRSP